MRVLETGERWVGEIDPKGRKPEREGEIKSDTKK